MIETSSHLIGHVIPKVPTRQWVLSFPWPLRLPFNSQPDLIHRAGLTRKAHARGGVITLIQRTLRQIVNPGALIEDPEQPWLNLQDPDSLDQLSTAAVHYRIAIGLQAGRRTLTITDPAIAQSQASEPSRVPKPFTVNQDGFSLNAAVSVPARRRDRLERLCRYITRPALCLERLSLRPDGRVQWQLKRPFQDGATHFVFTPEDLIARLAALVPRPQLLGV